MELTPEQKKKLAKMSTGEKVYSSHAEHMNAMREKLGIKTSPKKKEIAKKMSKKNNSVDTDKND